MSTTREIYVVRRGIQTLPNGTVWDKRLSWLGLALLTGSLAKPSGSGLGYRDLVGRGAGEKAVRSALAELEALGYRWRFYYRSNGKLKTATFVSYEPVTEAEAKAELEAESGKEMLRCVSVQDDAKTGKTPSHTVRQHMPHSGETSKTPSHTVPRSSAAQHSAAHPSAALPKGTKGLVKTKPNQTIKHFETEPESVGDGSVGSDWIQIEEQPSDVIDAPPTSEELNSDHEPTVSEGVDQSDWEVLLECLPESMHAVAPKMVGRIADRLRERLDGGWSAKRILEILDGNPLPGMVNNLTGLVIHRIGEIPTHAPHAPLPAETPTTSMLLAVEPDPGLVHDGIGHAHQVYNKLLAAGRIPNVARRVPHGTETTGPMSWQKWILLTDQGRTAGQCTPQCPACLCERQDDETPVVAA